MISEWYGCVWMLYFKNIFICVCVYILKLYKMTLNKIIL